MKTPHVKTIAHSLIAFIVLLLIGGTILLVKSVEVFGSPLLFALGLVVVLILLIVFLYSLVRALKTPLHIFGSLLRSALGGIITNPYVKRLLRTKTAKSTWVMARFDYKNPFGLLLTCGISVSAFFLIAFGGILRDVWFHAALTHVDTRVINLMPSIRTPLQTSFFRIITFSANAEAILLLVVLMGVLLWRTRQRVAAGALVAVLLVEEGSSFVLKHLIGRMRPERSLSLLKEDSFSFPSGHVLRATVIFGLLAYLLYRSYKSSSFRLGILLGYIMSVALVALSRVYLGVHYPSDVLASVLFGASLLTLIITGLEIIARYEQWGQNLKSFTNKQLTIVPLVIVLASLIASPIFVHLSTVMAIDSYKTLQTIDETSIHQLPLYSETLTGKTMEPVGFIYLGSEQQIEQIFLTHGWYKADRSTLANTLKAVSVGFQGHQYLNAPVTPSYLDAKPENLAFQQPTQSNTLRQRHHTRLWRTNFKLQDGTEIWVATASFDEGIEFAGPAKLPTHHINPNIDAERIYIVSSLGLKGTHYLQVVQAQAGNNASGDVFFTDGRSALITL